VSDNNWAIFQGELSLHNTRKAACALSGLDVWWMQRLALELYSQSEDHDYWSQLPEIPLGPGSCWLLITNEDQSTYALLKPAFLLPLRWTKETKHDARLPMALHEMADDIRKTFSIDEWTLHLNLNCRSTVKPSLTFLSIMKSDLSSAWTSLACGLVSALEAKSPMPNVWSTGAWTPEVGLSGVGGLEKKLALFHEYITERRRENDRFVLFVPRSNFDAAYDIKRKNRYAFEILWLQESVSDPNKALEEYFSWHEIRERDFSGFQLRPNTPPEQRLFEVKGLRGYTEADSRNFIGREKDVSELLSVVKRQLISALTGESGVGKSSLLQAGLCPELRKLDYHVAYIRLDKCPSTSIPERLFQELVGPGHFSLPLNYAHLRTELLQMRRTDQSQGLVMILDQFEEVVSDSSDHAELLNIRQFLQDAQQENSNWPIRVLCSYRADANLRIRELLSNINNNQVETVFLFGLERGLAAQLLDKAKAKIPECHTIDSTAVVDCLVEQSASFRKQNQVYPPFLQIFLIELERQRDPVIFIRSLRENVGNMIGDYLLTTLREMEGDHTRIVCTRVMQSLCLASGRRAPQSISRLSGEISYPLQDLKKAIKALEDRRLVTVSEDHVEIIHDQLALAVHKTLGEEDREAKLSTTLLEARLSKYPKLLELCSEKALIDLFRYRASIKTADDQLSYLFASRIASSSQTSDSLRPELPIGWYWTRNIHNDEEALLAMLRRLCKHDPLEGVRCAAIAQLGLFANPVDLSLLTGIAWRDTDSRQPSDDYSVQLAAVHVLTRFPANEVRDVLHAIATNQYHSKVRLAAAESLATLADHGCMELLKQLAIGEDVSIADAALEGIKKILSDEDLPWLRSLFKSEHSRLRKFAVEQVANFEQPEDRHEIKQLCNDTNAEVAVTAIEALANFDHVEDLPDLRILCDSPEVAVARAAEAVISTFGNPNASMQLVEYLSAPKATVQTSAIMALANLGHQQGLNQVRDLVYSEDRTVRLTAISALKMSTNPSDLVTLLDILHACSIEFVSLQGGRREISNKFDKELADTILVTLKHRASQFTEEESLELLSADSPWARSLGICALTKQAVDSSIPLFLGMVDGVESIVRIEIAESLLLMCPGSFPFEKLFYDEDPGVRLIAIRSLAASTISADQASALSNLAVSDDDESVQLAAINQLLNNETLETLMLLREIAESPSYSNEAEANNLDNPVIKAAIRGVLRWRSADAIESLKEMTSSRSANCRSAAATALCAIADRNMLESWLSENTFQLKPDVLTVLDEHLYAPQWWRERNLNNL
jgi:HEAT repeat protein